MHRAAPPPPPDRIDYAKRRILETYPKTAVPRMFEGPVHRVTDDQIIAAMQTLKSDSNPGFPLGFLEQTKGKIAERRTATVVAAVRARLDLLNGVDLTTKSYSATELYDKGYTDPIRVFGKNEPHTKQKLDAGRLRLIASVSEIDEIIERLLCSTQNNAEIDRWDTCPSKPGIGFSDDQTKTFYKSVQDIFPDGLAEADVSAWDWCVQSWMFEAEVDLRIKLCGASPDSSFARILRNRILCLARSLLVTSDGEVYEQTVDGIMKSGSYLTSSSNSRMRNFVAHVVGAQDSMAMGDDSLETRVVGATEKYRELGINVKFYKEATTEFEFCSNVYRLSEGGPTAEPQNWVKGLFRLLTNKPSLELLMQFLHEYRHSPHLEEAKALILESGWNSKTNKTDDLESKEEVSRLEASPKGGRSCQARA